MNVYSSSQSATDATARRAQAIHGIIKFPARPAAVPCAEVILIPAAPENGEDRRNHCAERELRDGLAALASVAGETLLKSRLYFSAACLAQVGPPCARHAQMARDLEALARNMSARPVGAPPASARAFGTNDPAAPFLRAICALRTAVRMTQYAAQLCAFLADTPNPDARLAPLRDTADAIQRLIFKVATTWEHNDQAESDRQAIVRALAEAEATLNPAPPPHPSDAAHPRMARAARLCLLVAGEAVAAAAQTNDQAAPTTNFCDLYDDLTVHDGEFLLKA